MPVCLSVALCRVTDMLINLSDYVLTIMHRELLTQQSERLSL